MPSRADVALVAALALAGCAGAPEATWRVPPTYADAPGEALPPVAAGALPSGGGVAAAPSPQISAPLPPEAGTPSGPVGTSGVSVASSSAPLGYDHVGYASWQNQPRPGTPSEASASHRTLPPGSFAEVTSLETGRTIVVLITGRTPDNGREIALSSGAAQALGIGAEPTAGVRVRAMVPSPADVAALRNGQLASARLDTPEPVLRALRRQLGAAPEALAADTPTRPRPRTATAAPAKAAAKRAGAGYAVPGRMPTAGAPTAAPPQVSRTAPQAAPTSDRRVAKTSIASVAAPVRTGFVVQVAAFSTEERARNLARTLRGNIAPGGGVWRVRLGPYRDYAQAQAARDAAVARGYGDAAILMAP